VKLVDMCVGTVEVLTRETFDAFIGGNSDASKSSIISLRQPPYVRQMRDMARKGVAGYLLRLWIKSDTVGM
jgi:hypothetical protein